MKSKDKEDARYWLAGKIILGTGLLLLLGALMSGLLLHGTVFHPILAATNNPANCISGPDLVNVRQCVGFEEPMSIRVASIMFGVAMVAYSVALGTWLYRAGSTRLLRALKWAGGITGVAVVLTLTTFFLTLPHSQQTRFFAADSEHNHIYALTEKPTVGYGMSATSLFVLELIYALGYVGGSSIVLYGRRYAGARIAGMRKEDLFQ